MKKTGWILITLCSVLGLRAQQDPQYSQYMFNQVILNPAYIGSKDALNATALFRKQWVGINGAPQTSNLSISGPLRRKNISLGGHMVQETIGPKNWLSAYVDYSYKLKLGPGKLSFGLSTGLVNYNFNIAKLNLQDGSEPLQYYNVGHVTRFDMNGGVYYHTSSFYAGLSMSHLTQPRLFDEKQSGNAVFYNLDRHAFLTLGKGFLLSDNLVMNPSVVVKMVDRQVSADVNLNFLVRSKLWLGASYRAGNAIVVLAQYRVNDSFKIGYSYDRYVKGALTAAGGSHEIMLGFDLRNYKSKTVSPRFL